MPRSEPSWRTIRNNPRFTKRRVFTFGPFK
jgi:hypothetical protein